MFKINTFLLRVFNVHLQVASINKIPKPKPKTQKPIKNETEGSEQNTDNSDSTSTDGSSPSEETVDEQPEAHDEL